MVERWVKSAVSPDWTVILGWGTFWISPAANPAASSRHAAVETTLLSWKTSAVFQISAFPSENIHSKGEGTIIPAYIPESLRNSDLAETTSLGKFRRDKGPLISERLRVKVEILEDG